MRPVQLYTGYSVVYTSHLAADLCAVLALVHAAGTVVHGEEERRVVPAHLAIGIRHVQLADITCETADVRPGETRAGRRDIVRSRRDTVQQADGTTHSREQRIHVYNTQYTYRLCTTF